jgi:hypothetical protein
MKDSVKEALQKYLTGLYVKITSQADEYKLQKLFESKIPFANTDQTNWCYSTSHSFVECTYNQDWVVRHRKGLAENLAMLPAGYTVTTLDAFIEHVDMLLRDGEVDQNVGSKQKRSSAEVLRDAEAKGFVKGAAYKIPRLSQVAQGVITEVAVWGLDDYLKHRLNVSLSDLEFLKLYAAGGEEPLAFIKYSNGYYYSITEVTVVVEPERPVVNKHRMETYSKGDTYVVFGCARISITMLRGIVSAYESTSEDASNRSIASVKLTSDVEITYQQIKDILVHVDYIDNKK